MNEQVHFTRNAPSDITHQHRTEKESDQDNSCWSQIAKYTFKKSDNEQKMPQSQITDQPLAQYGRDTEHNLSHENKNTIKAKQVALSSQIHLEIAHRTIPQNMNPTQKTRKAKKQHSAMERAYRQIYLWLKL